MVFDRFRPLILLVVAAGLPLAGCVGEASHGDRVPLTGTVTKGGKPLEDNATIFFNPAGGAAGIGASGGVSEGKFSIPEENGPTPGQSYEVTVTTVTGIPAEGTPRNQIRTPKTYKKIVEIPPRGKEAPLVIDFK